MQQRISVAQHGQSRTVNSGGEASGPLCPSQSGPSLSRSSLLVSIFVMLSSSTLFAAPGAGTVQESYDDLSQIDTGRSTGYLVSGGALRLSSAAEVGNGLDGACSVASGTKNLSSSSCANRSTPDAPSFIVTANTASGQPEVVLSATPAGLTVGDEILIINLQGTSTNFSAVGQFETHRILAISGMTLTLASNLEHAYDGGTQKVMVQRVPNYSSVTVSGGAVMTADAWNGARGGVLFFRSTGAVTVAGSLDMSAKGYTGGVPNNASPWNYGQPGESYFGPGPQSSQSTSVFAANGGGGGGADPGNCGPIWPLSGGGGGYAGTGSTGSTSGCGASPPSSNVARGGGAYGSAQLSQLFPGSGGGAGGSDIGLDGGDCHTGGAGGSGGGIIAVYASSLLVSGGVLSNGANGVQDRSSGGAGAGGSIRLEAGSVTLGTGLVRARGGTSSSDPYCAVPSGAGSAGRIAVYSASINGTSDPALSSASLPNFSTQADIQSTNLLADLSPVDSIDRLTYSLAALPSNTSASIQFSQDGANWYDATGAAGGTSPLSAGSAQSIDLSALGWSSASFYYRLSFSSDGVDTPALDELSLEYCGDAIDLDGDGLGDACDSDDDNDGVEDLLDNCPAVLNADQADNDEDLVGDVCDDDDDDDFVGDGSDNCPFDVNTDQADFDDDGAGDVCDADDDNDSIDDAQDNCPQASNSQQLDSDGDSEGDACDADDDNDSVSDLEDNCVFDSNSDQADYDGDGAGDVCDADDDNDSVGDTIDNCPFTFNPDQVNLDEDSEGDACDADADGDGQAAAQDCNDFDATVATPQSYFEDADADGFGDPGSELVLCQSTAPDGYVGNGSDNCPLDSNPLQTDTDGDGQGNVCDDDDDDDLVPDTADNCPLVPNSAQTDTDLNGTGDACEADQDGDGYADDLDNCIDVPNTDQVDFDEDGEGDVCDLDIDGDEIPGVDDCNDYDPTTFEDSTFYADKDADGFGDSLDTILICALAPPDGYVTDDTDNCASLYNPDQQDTDLDGMGNLCDADDDNDSVLDEADNCPLVSNVEQTDTDENGTGDACEDDQDGDGISDALDNCPSTANTNQDDLDQDGLGDVCDEDVDGDGILKPADCDDRDDSISEEQTYYQDTDLDGVGETAGPIQICSLTAPEGYVEDGGDNCPELANPDQADSDEDGIGDACDDVATPTPEPVTPTPQPETPTPDEATATPPGDESPTPADDVGGGCSCAIPASPSGLPGSSVLSGLLVAAFLLRRRISS